MTEIGSTLPTADWVVQNKRQIMYIEKAEVFLRTLTLILFVTGLALVVSSEQSKTFPVVIPGLPAPIMVTAKAKYTYLPQVLYFAEATSVVILYSIITTIVSLSKVMNFKTHFTSKLAIYIVMCDVVFLGITASAGGTAAGASYIGFKGNEHLGWRKMCNLYKKFCWQAGSGIAVALVASIVQVLLIMLYVVAQYKKIPKEVHLRQNGITKQFA